MKRFTPWVFVLVSVLSLGCSEDDPELTVCEGGPCERQEDCEAECEGVCGSPDFLSFQCIEDACQCECFFGCQ